MNLDLADRLKDARVAANLDKRAVAARMGMSESAIRHHENGTREPDLETLWRYAKLYRVSTDWLLSGVGPGPDGLDEVATELRGLSDRDRQKALSTQHHSSTEGRLTI